MHRRKVAEVSVRLKEASDKLERCGVRLSQMETVLKEKTRAVVEEADARRRLAEQVEVLQKKIHSLSSASWWW